MRPVTVRGRGHRNVRASHAKTIEVTTDADLTHRGTCIVAVAADLDPARLDGLSGPVVVTLEAGEVRDDVRGVANPRYDASTGRLVIRRSHHRSPDTLVFDADKGSVDLDRALARVLADPGAELRLTIAADDAADDGDDHHVFLDADLAAAQAVAARVATLAGDAGSGPLPVAFAGVLGRRASDRRHALHSPPSQLTVWQVRPRDLGDVAAIAGDRLVAVVTDPATPHERVHREPATLERATTAFVVVRTPDRTTDDDSTESLLGALLAAGVPTRTLQDALVAVTGVGRRDAYERVLRSRGA